MPRTRRTNPRPGIRRGTLCALLLGSLVPAACGDGPGAGDRDSVTAGAPGSSSILAAKGCTQCHAVERLGLAADVPIGPDLSEAATGVRDRYGRDLEGFFEHPSGTMQMVLSSQIRLSRAERDSIISVLEALTPEPDSPDRPR
jgi:mono/diheme cytochrome c family protein